MRIRKYSNQMVSVIKMKKTIFLEVYKVRDKANLVFYRNGELMSSDVVYCDDNTIKYIKKICRQKKVQYQIYR